MKLSLPPSFENLAKSLQNMQPGISMDEAIVVADRLVHETSRRLALGEKLAFLKNLPDGSMDITVIEHLLKNKNSE